MTMTIVCSWFGVYQENAKTVQIEPYDLHRLYDKRYSEEVIENVSIPVLLFSNNDFQNDWGGIIEQIWLKRSSAVIDSEKGCILFEF